MPPRVLRTPPATPAPPPRRLVSVEPLDLRLALAVKASLLDEARPKLGQGSEQRVGLVQRVRDLKLGAKLELETDPLRTVRDLEDGSRLRVDVPAALVTEEIALGDLAAGGVLDVRDNVCAAVEARRLRNRRTSTRAL